MSEYFVTVFPKEEREMPQDFPSYFYDILDEYEYEIFSK